MNLVESRHLLIPLISMKKFFFLPLLLLAACGSQVVPAQPSPVVPSAPVAVESSVAPVASPEWKSVVLVDQDYNVTQKGKEWLQAIGTKQITGNVSQARLNIDLSRGNDDKGWSAIGMYIAPLAQGNGFVYPDESVYGSRLHFIAAEWRGDCKRHLAPSSSFGVLKEHSNRLIVELGSVPVTQGEDGCETGMKMIDVESMLNDGGVYLGFMPSNVGYHAKVTLEYVGEIEVKSF